MIFEKGIMIMEFNKEELLRKYKEICNTHTEIFKPDFTNGEYTLRSAYPISFRQITL